MLPDDIKDKYRIFNPEREFIVNPVEKSTRMMKVSCMINGGHVWSHPIMQHGRTFEVCENCHTCREKNSEFHKHSFKNYKELSKSNIIGCFYCFHKFEFAQIKEWVDNGQTGLCPNCNTDSLVGNISNYPIYDKDFLKEMFNIWFVEKNNKLIDNLLAVNYLFGIKKSKKDAIRECFKRN
jgi:uncharacterized CHY-type Zn-finger protein